ncbi:D123-domain-containing protein [Halteromyces radiatus]|uniref:D123-domain-containing protein n=1 Tax=Halteromyces radiatus TaxID=101107 RepID=UPI00222007B2|nr:D123-domain-containing protein [Halteromyces radiatus]KAI8099474.1 D123-domain-containing protein [Halteromyces radiatus]
MFNNAGIMHPQDDNALNTEEKIWNLTMDINVKGVWFGCKHAILAMRKTGGGSIINTASFVALMGAATPQLAYTASKGAVLAMTRELAMVHARENIRFNSLCPGPIRTPLLMDFLNTEEKKQRRLVHVPQGRFGEAIEQANGALFLASDESSFVTGTDFRVDGGLSAAYVTPEVTFKSKIIPLSTEFIDYLNADGIYLPTDGQPQAAATIEELDSSDEDDATNDITQENIPHFPQVEQAIRQAIDEFGGAVFPKLNWSSPRDAAWITATQSLKCTSPFDVYLLLKSSDFINHDLNHAFDHCQQQEPTNISYNLILRKWHDLQPSLEFRCFVKNKELIGISQRDLTYYDFLLDIQQELETKIYEFFEDHIRDGFPGTEYVFDVYVQQDRQKVWLVDFNPFDTTTDGLLYSWNELLTFDVNNQEPEIRIIASTIEASEIACNAPRFATNMVPKDVIDLSDGRSIAEFAEEFQRAMALSATHLDDTDDSD